MRARAGGAGQRKNVLPHVGRLEFFACRLLLTIPSRARALFIRGLRSAVTHYRRISFGVSSLPDCQDNPDSSKNRLSPLDT